MRKTLEEIIFAAVIIIITDMLINYFNYQLTPKHRFYRDEKLFEFFSFENDFAKYFIKYCNSFI